MDKAVVVFSFPEPKEDQILTFPMIVERSRTVFENMENVRVHAAIQNAADEILDILDPSGETDSNLVKHAKDELYRLENDQDFNDMIVKVVRAFASYGHSGGSASVAIHMINDLLQFKNLSPLTNDPVEWNHVGEETWQSRRNPEAFSRDGGKTYTLLSEASEDGKDGPTYLSFASDAEREDEG